MDRTESRPEIKQEELLGDIKHTIGAGPSPVKATNSKYFHSYKLTVKHTGNSKIWFCLLIFPPLEERRRESWFVAFSDSWARSPQPTPAPQLARCSSQTPTTNLCWRLKGLAWTQQFLLPQQPGNLIQLLGTSQLEPPHPLTSVADR